MQEPSPAERGPQTGLIVAAILIAVLAVVTVIGALTVLQLPEPVTEQAQRINRLYHFTLGISMLVFFGVSAGIIWAIFRYKRRGPELPAQVHGSSALELTWTAVPVIILVGLFIPSLLLVIDLKTPPAPGEADVEIVVVGHQWWWEFQYPAANVRVQTTPPDYTGLQPPVMVVPVGQVVRVEVRSTDVIHSFYAPQFLYKIQAVPGNINVIHFKVEKAGVYYGQCYQFCGLRHSDMLFLVDARAPADYQRWLREQRRAQGVASDEELATNAGGN